jgi:quercetin dioxygenase-like cupin family protein
MKVRRMTRFGVLCSLVAAGASLALLRETPALAVDGDGQALIITPDNVTRYKAQQGATGVETELLATSEQTGGKLGIFRQTVAPGSGPPTHLHGMEVEFAYVVSGQFKFKVGDRVVSAPPGSFLYVPSKTPHTFKNDGPEPGVLLFGVTPGGFEMMFAERQGVDAETNKKLMQKHHMEVVGPPLQ